MTMTTSWVPMAPLCPSWKAAGSTRSCTMHIALNTVGRIPRRLTFWVPLTPLPQCHQSLLQMRTEYCHHLLMAHHRRDRVCGHFRHQADSCTRRCRGSPRFVVLDATEYQILASLQPHGVIPPVYLAKMTISTLGRNLRLRTAQICLPRLHSVHVRRPPKRDGSSLLGGHVDSKSYQHRDRRRICWTTGISRLIQGGRRILSG